MGDPVDDAALVQRCLSGDSDALRSLVLRFQGVVFSLCVRMLGDRHEAEDVAQETFIRLVRHAPGYEGRGQFSAWLQTIARRLSLNVLRTRKRRPEVSIEAAFDRPSRVDAEKGLELKEVQRALARLPKRQRKALWLKAAEGLSYREIAEALACSESDVANAVFRGRETLAKLLGA